MRERLPFLALLVLTIIVVMAMSVFTVDQRQSAVVFQLGEIKRVVRAPGIYLKLPLIQNVSYFDNRVLTFETAVPERYNTREKKNVLVDLFVKWRIVDPLTYYISVSGDEARARTRLEQTVNAGMREEFGKRTVHEVVSGEREAIMQLMRAKADLDARKIGVEVVDVRLKQVNLPTEVSDSVYRRMESERKSVASQRRANGAAEAEKIRADADRTREIKIAEAYRDAQRVKGEADAESAAIYAEAFGRNPEFYAFYRSLEAYRQSFKGRDVIVLDPSTEFFKYYRAAGNAKGAGK